MKSVHVPGIDLRYWIAISLASVFGTNMGDLYAHESGLGIGLGLVAPALQFARARATRVVAIYWITVAIARTAGTAIGDWLAENKFLHIGLPLGTLLSDLAFAAVVLLWKSGAKPEPAFSRA